MSENLAGRYYYGEF